MEVSVITSPNITVYFFSPFNTCSQILRYLKVTKSVCLKYITITGTVNANFKSNAYDNM